MHFNDCSNFYISVFYFKMSEKYVFQHDIECAKYTTKYPKNRWFYCHFVLILPRKPAECGKPHLRSQGSAGCFVHFSA